MECRTDRDLKEREPGVEGGEEHGPLPASGRCAPRLMCSEHVLRHRFTLHATVNHPCRPCNLEIGQRGGGGDLASSPSAG